MAIAESLELATAFSNAVLVAILPHVSDFADKLNLDTVVPITTGHVQAFGPDRTSVGGTVVLTNGMAFSFSNGRVSLYTTPEMRREYSGEAIKSDSLTLTERAAVEASREKLRSLGYALDELYADLTPEVQLEAMGSHLHS